MKCAALWLLVALVAVPAPAGEPPPGWQAALAEGAPLRVRVRPIEIVDGKLTGLDLAGAWVLSGDHREFGGFSGLIVRDGRLMAVSDQGWWLDARLTRQGDRLDVADAVMAPMHDAGGDGYSKAGGDAEDLTWGRDGLAVSFERDHRIMRLGPDGRLGATVHSRAFERFPSNKSLEALAALPDGDLLVLPEGTDDDAVPVFRITPADEVTERSIPRAGIHAVTGADVGPDGRLYLVLRDYTVLLGVSIRVMRYRLDADGWPVADSGEVLAAFESASGIDNMEGISVERTADGALWLWLISDDNFNAVQRTLLMLFAVAE